MKKIISFTAFLLVIIGSHGQIPFINIIEFSNQIHEYSDLVAVENVIQAPYNGFRNLFFIHGLGGNPSAWTKVPEACFNEELNISDFPARKCFVSRPDYTYSTNGTLTMAAADVLTQIKSFNTSYLSTSTQPNKGILIGHSQGGLVARSLMHYNLNLPQPDYGNDYGGFISIASPLQGAMILNNRDMIVELAKSACRDLSAGPLQDMGIFHKLLKMLLGNTYNEIACNKVIGGALPMFFDQYYDKITDDYKVGAPYITTLNNDILNSNYCRMPKLALYAVEPREKLFWRTAQWLVNDPNEVGHFQANDDFALYDNNIQHYYLQYYTNWANAVKRLNYLKSQEKVVKATAFLSLGVTYGLYLQQVKKHLGLKEAWGRGKDWFETVDSRWEVVIGAKTYTQTNTVIYLCIACLGIPGAIIPVDDPSYCSLLKCSSTIEVPATINETIVVESDGIITRQTAENLPCATNSPIRVSPVFSNSMNQGTSHMQIRNDEGIRRALKDIFNGMHGDFFYMPIKY